MNSEILRKRIIKWGASIVGFGNLNHLLPDESKQLHIGISIAIRLSNAIIDGIKEAPTFTYAYHYRVTNQLLDFIALKASNLLQSRGYEALPIPASQTVNHEKLEGLFPHKTVATRASLGWIGKNALLITPEYGPRVRLASVLTDAPLEVSQPISESRCEQCSLCVKACPAKALTGKSWQEETKREELIDVGLCHEVTQRNKIKFGEPICGICVSVCPFGKANTRT